MNRNIWLIVVHQLAETDETLWLRMLGREENQNRAIQEFLGQSTLLRGGSTLDFIIRATGLPIETIESLRDRV